MEQKPSGKLDNIKNISAILPELDVLRSRTREARVDLDALMMSLREKRQSIVTMREEQIRREEKQKEFEGLRQQRADEKKEAERIIDQKAAELKEKRAQKADADVERKKVISERQSSNFGDRNVNREPQREIQPFVDPRPLHRQPAYRQQQSERPQGFGNQRQFGGEDPRTGQQGGFGQRPFGGNSGAGVPSRTWTPSQATNNRQQGGFGQRQFGDRPGFGQGNPRPFGAMSPTSARPGFGPRPGGFGNNQGGFGNRPAGTGFGPRTGGFAGQRPAGVGTVGAIRPTERFVTKTDTSQNKKKGGENQRFGGERTAMDRRALLRRGIIEEQEIEERMLTRIFKTKKAKDSGAIKATRSADSAIVITTNNITVKDLSEKIGKTAPEIIKQLIVLGNMCTINSTIDFATAELVSGEFGVKLELNAEKSFEEQMGDIHRQNIDDTTGYESRPPVVTVMGHVDHGKTSLLDAFRQTNVVLGESGGITQHIGAYQVKVKHNKLEKKITFIDTPGHAAFDKMRARGAKITDIAILIVAADDGVMPQTIEAIKHIQGQELPMIVAINKIDKPEAKVDRVIEQLAEHNVIAESWGGSAIMVPCSAHTREGLDKLLEMILLVADLNDYKANPNKEAQGSIIDAKLDKTKGPLVTVLVQSGTLKVGDTLLAGTTYGKVKNMTDENGKPVRTAKPSRPIMVLGFSEVPKAGDAVYVVDEKLTKQVVSERKDKEKVKRANVKVDVAGIDALAQLTESAKKQLNVIIKGDVAGSVEAINQSIANIISDEVTVNVISSGVGSINDNDVTLAEMSNALLVAFHTKVTGTAKTKAEKAKIKIHEFKVIYEIFDFITDKMVRLFSPKFQTIELGKVEVRALFRSSAIGQIAGCMVTDGKVTRNGRVRLIRGKEDLGEFKIGSLKIKTNDTKEVGSGFECGIKLDNAPDLRVGDIFEVIGKEQLPIIWNGKKYDFENEKK